MKLIEYKPDLGKVILTDIKNIPEDFDFKKFKKLISENRIAKINIMESHSEIVDSGSTWVHPDYRVPEDKYIAGHDPYGSQDEKGKIKIYKRKSENSFNGNSLNNLFIPFPDPEGLNPFIDYKVWEAAMPKFRNQQIKKYSPPIFFGTSGKENIHTDLAIFLLDSEKIKNEVFGDDYFEELHWLSESPAQESDWIKRKKKCPTLTVDDFLWIDRMVDKIFAKHTNQFKSKKYGFFNPQRFNPIIPKNKFLGPLF